MDAFRQAYELDPERVSRYAADDRDLDSVRAEISAIAGQTNSASSGS